LRVEFSIRHDDTGRVVYSTNVDAQTTGDRYVSQGHWISGSAEPGTYTLMARLFDGTRELGTYELPMFVGGG
jgi:hypothetical protein